MRDYKHILSYEYYKDWSDWYTPDNNQKEEKCQHEWKSIVLITSIVYNCSKCGIKQEDEK